MNTGDRQGHKADAPPYLHHSSLNKCGVPVLGLAFLSGKEHKGSHFTDPAGANDYVSYTWIETCKKV